MIQSESPARAIRSGVRLVVSLVDGVAVFDRAAVEAHECTVAMREHPRRGAGAVVANPDGPSPTKMRAPTRLVDVVTRATEPLSSNASHATPLPPQT